MQSVSCIVSHVRRHSLLYIGAVVVVVLILLYAFDPSQQVLAPKCIVRSLTGLSCPGCGFQRAMHALLHGHPVEAVRFNPFLLLCLPYLAGLATAQWVLREPRRSRWMKVLGGKGCVYFYLVAYFAWGIVRNLLGV